MMKKVATIAALGMMAQQAMGVCVTTSNWIAVANGFTSIGDPTAGTANDPYTHDNTWLTCASLTAGGSCCTKDQVATFQTKANTLVSTLETAVSTRDQYILDRRGDVISVRDSLNSIQESITALAGDSASVAASLELILSAYTDAIETFTQDFDALKAGFLTLQSTRATCFNALVKAQVTIWCAACTEVITTVGLTDASTDINFGSAFTTYLANACSAYVTNAVEQSDILSLYQVSDTLALLASALSKLADGDAEGAATEITEFLADYNAITDPTNELHRVAHAPTSCTTTACAWASELLIDGTLDTDLATVGGYLTEQSRRLQDAPAGRMLQLAATPETETAGITVDFPTNPGNVDNDQNSAVRNGAIACAITALAALF